MKHELKFAVAALVGLMSTASQADPFYLDPGSLYQAPAGDQMCPTCTGMKNEMTIKYRSSSVVTDLDGNGIDAGDSIVTNAGLAAGGGIAANQVTSLNPGGFGSGLSDNGFGSSYGVTFSITNLTGSIAAVIGGVPYLAYGPGGTINLSIYNAGGILANFMNIDVTGGATDGVGTGLWGNVSFNGLLNASPAEQAAAIQYANLFHSGTTTCNTGSGLSSGFYDIWKYCGAGAVPPIDLSVMFLAHFDTNIQVSQFGLGPVVGGNQTYSLTSNHDGSFTFAVPEPASVGLVGLGLVAAGLVRRRKQSA